MYIELPVISAIHNTAKWNSLLIYCKKQLSDDVEVGIKSGLRGRHYVSQIRFGTLRSDIDTLVEIRSRFNSKDVIGFEWLFLKNLIRSGLDHIHLVL